MEENSTAGDDRPLAEYRVLDLSRALAGPHCTGLLADLGASVTKVEDPRGGDETRAWGPPFHGVESAYFLAVNRSRRSVAVDLKDPECLELVQGMAEVADVVVENFRPGVVTRLGLGYASIRARNPGVVYASISAYGQDGPAAREAGYDLIVQGTGGLMSVTGEPGGGPVKAGVAQADIIAGTNAAVAIVGALLARERRFTRDGELRGEYLDVALFDGQVSLMGYHLVSHLVSGRVPGRTGNRFPFIVPYQSFAASDGELVVAVPNERLWRLFAQAIGRLELLDDGRFSDNGARVRHRDELVPMIEAAIRERSVAEWLDAFRESGIPCGAINDIGQVARSSYVADRGLLHEVQGYDAGPVKIPGQPWRTGLPGERNPVVPPGRPPRLGEHTVAAMREAGWDEEKITRSASRGAAFWE
jgi:crotonobetainyl-CoA:carnitine CoA-transferase CaiB-like acyl-CoA transferase